jgi:hypothetical protein
MARNYRTVRAGEHDEDLHDPPLQHNACVVAEDLPKRWTHATPPEAEIHLLVEINRRPPLLVVRHSRHRP